MSKVDSSLNFSAGMANTKNRTQNDDNHCQNTNNFDGKRAHPSHNNRDGCHNIHILKSSIINVDYYIQIIFFLNLSTRNVMKFALLARIRRMQVAII